MIDISRQNVELKCECGRKHSATFQDVINHKVIACSCGTKIQLQDNGSVRKSVTDINKAFRGLDNAFKKFGR